MMIHKNLNYKRNEHKVKIKEKLNKLCRVYVQRLY